MLLSGVFLFNLFGRRAVSEKQIVFLLFLLNGTRFVYPRSRNFAEFFTNLLIDIFS